jgi:hypothetical protein
MARLLYFTKKPKLLLMIRLIITVFCMSVLLRSAEGQINVNKILNSVSTGDSGSGLSGDQITEGLKQALEKGAESAVKSTSVEDGFFGNSLIRIPFPPEAEQMEDKLRSMGMSKQVDEFILSLNRAAEDASKSALPILTDAVTGMTVEDGMVILKGPDDAATSYLRESTGEKLTDKFTPIISQSLENVEVTRYWTPLVNAYNSIPFVKSQNPDLEAYVTEKGIDGLFTMIAKEEKAIRENPAARTTDLLKKVFGEN